MIKLLRKIFVRIFLYNYGKPFNQRNFGEVAKASKTIGLILPDREDIIDAALLLVGHALKKGKEVTVILPNQLRRRFEGFHKVKFIEYFPGDKGKIGLPKSAFIDRIKFTECEIIVSLDLGLDDFCIVCALLFKSRLKIGFKSPFADKIFQIQLVAIENSIKKSIENLINYYRIF